MSDESKYAMLVDPDMQEIVESFIVESNEILEELDHDLVQLESKPEDDELLNQIFRAFHTIKGTSGFLGLDRLTKVTHRCEDILNKLRKRETKLSSDLMDVILLGYDKIKELVVVIENDKNENVEIDDTIIQLENAIKRIENPEEVHEKILEDVANEVVDEKFNEEIVEAEIEEVTDKEFPVEVVEEVKAEEKIEEPQPKIIIAKEKNVIKQPQRKIEDTNIRVDVERLDELLNIVSELVLGRNQLAQVNSEVALDYEGSMIN